MRTFQSRRRGRLRVTFLRRLNGRSFFFFKIDLRERESKSESGGGEEGENLQADSMLSTEPDVGLNPTTLRS